MGGWCFVLGLRMAQLASGAVETTLSWGGASTTQTPCLLCKLTGDCSSPVKHAKRCSIFEKFCLSIGRCC